MSSEFNLSKEIMKSDFDRIIQGEGVIMVKDVKEFIRLLKEAIMNVPCIPEHASEAYYRHIEKLAGDKLT